MKERFSMQPIDLFDPNCFVQEQKNSIKELRRIFSHRIIEDLANTLQVCFDVESKKILLPMSNGADIAKVPAELFSKFQASFYTIPEDDVIKSLGL